MTGYVRIIKYTNDSVDQYVRNESNVDIGTSQRITIDSSKPQNFHILEVTEGSLFYGEKSGYNRILNCVKGTCELGFFHEDEPRGKYCVYNLDGTFEKEEGLYENAQICKTKI